MEEKLTKKEKKQFAKSKKLVDGSNLLRAASAKSTAMKVVALLVLVFGIYKIYAWFTTPVDESSMPGRKIEDMGRDHVTDISGIEYSSNPPTSGPHFPVWAKKGVYSEVLSDGYLIHSLEHGYIVISYDCGQLTAPETSFGFVSTVSAHEGEELPESTGNSDGAPLHAMKVGLNGEMSAFTPENAPAKEVDLPDEFSMPECKNLVDELSPFVDNWERVVVVPRLGMNTPIALTAWTRLETLDSFDADKIESFIKAYHNAGPEKTVE